jgi:hypothetical protein
MFFLGELRENDTPSSERAHELRKARRAYSVFN